MMKKLMTYYSIMLLVFISIVSCSTDPIDNEEEDTAADCPELSFEVALDGGHFFHPASFDGIDNATLSWSIDGEFIENTSGNESFFFQFDPGIYEVCVFLETPECPQGITFCETITVQ